jgi:hypothetical protein
MIPEPLQFNGNDLSYALLRDPSLKLLDIEAEKSAPNQFADLSKYTPADYEKKKSLVLFV